jgi:tetratricopeptide (TPR) repeat protein
VQKRLEDVQKELIDFYFDYMTLNSKYYKKWDTLCALRDRAYIAESEGNTNAVIKNASLALKISPYDREAHILLARALLRRNNETDRDTVSFLLDDYLKHHQGQEAPGYLLKGVVNLKKDKLQEAVIDFDQAAAYYPKQQEIIQNRLNLYHKRSFLNKSKEGRLIMNMYRSMMSGAGYFSPDFQLARLLLKRGEKMNARKKVFEHFFRRRQQGEWDKVLDDFRYASQYLDTDLFHIMATDQKRIKIDIESAMFANSVIVNIINDSETDIHNVTILLCVRFTDMFKGDYITFPVGDTLSLVKAQEKISVGRRNISDITEKKLGEEKEFKDIIEYAGVLISDEMILWIEPNKIGEATETFLSEKLKTDETILAKKIQDIPVKDIDKKLIKMGKEYLKSSVDSLLDDAVKSIKDNVAKALDGSEKEILKKDDKKQDDKKQESHDEQKTGTPNINKKPIPVSGKDNI